jgi:hypothetical protein
VGNDGANNQKNIILGDVVVLANSQAQAIGVILSSI